MMCLLEEGQPLATAQAVVCREHARDMIGWAFAIYTIVDDVGVAGTPSVVGRRLRKHLHTSTYMPEVLNVSGPGQVMTPTAGHRVLHMARNASQDCMIDTVDGPRFR